MANEARNPLAEKSRAALLLVDIQPDFLPGGALPIETGNDILQPVRKLIASERFGLYVATQDWHPYGHISFASRHPGRRPFETIELYGHEQTLWPDHCIQGTSGAQLYPELPWNVVSAIIRKGTDPETDSYSGFRNNWNAEGERPSTGLAGYLENRGITDIFVCGLARDVCVKWTAEDGADAGFKVWFLWDAARPVDPTSDERVRVDLSAKGVQVITTEHVFA